MGNFNDAIRRLGLIDPMAELTPPEATSDRDDFRQETPEAAPPPCVPVEEALAA
jgi:hypothetical protein